MAFREDEKMKENRTVIPTSCGVFSNFELGYLE